MERVGWRIKPRLRDLAVHQLNEYRPAMVALAESDVLEIEYVTGLNLRHHPSAVKSLVGVDPLAGLLSAVHDSIARAAFQVEHHTLCTDNDLAFNARRFDPVFFTWTLCSLPNPVHVLTEMRRVAQAGRKAPLRRTRAERLTEDSALAGAAEPRLGASRRRLQHEQADPRRPCAAEQFRTHPSRALPRTQAMRPGGNVPRRRYSDRQGPHAIDLERVSITLGAEMVASQTSG